MDRSGAPCRKWERKPLQLKSFTGIAWQLPSWRTPKPQKIEENNEGKDGGGETGDSDSKTNNDNNKKDNKSGNKKNNDNSNTTSNVPSGIPSEKSNSGDGDVTPLPSNMESSPPIPLGA